MIKISRVIMTLSELILNLKINAEGFEYVSMFCFISKAHFHCNIKG